MSKKRVVGKPFKKGQSGNPAGRPPLPDDIKEARALNRTELERIINKFLYMNQNEIAAQVNSKTLNVLENLVCSVILRSIKDGDHVRFNFVLEQVLGVLPKTYKVHNFSEIPDDKLQNKIQELFGECIKGSPAIKEMLAGFMKESGDEPEGT